MIKLAKLNLKGRDKSGKQRICGFMEIKNQTENSADLFFYGDIVSETWQSEWYEEDMAPGDVKAFLDDLDGVDNINIHINSGGGSVFGGIAIYNLLKRNAAYKTVYIDGIAASIASVIAMCGDKIIVPGNATMMIHKPMNSYFFTTKNADELRKDADSLDTCQKSIMQIYMTKAKIGEEEIEEKLNEETWMSGREIAEVFDVEIEEDNQAAAYAGSTMFFCYKNVPKTIAASSAKPLFKNNLSDSELGTLIRKEVQNGLRREKEKETLLKSLDRYGERK